MKKLTLAAIVALSAFAALPASAHDQRGCNCDTGRSRPAVDVNANVLSQNHRGGSLASVDATVKGVANVDADVLSKSHGKTSVLDLDAQVGKGKGALGLGADLDISKRKGLDLDVTLGGRSRGPDGHEGGGRNYDFGGGVGGGW